MIFSSAPNDFLNLKYSDELYHHGIKGQKWGIRRYQNPDGSLTAEGIKRYRIGKGLFGIDMFSNNKNKINTKKYDEQKTSKEREEKRQEYSKKLAEAKIFENKPGNKLKMDKLYKDLNDIANENRWNFSYDYDEDDEFYGKSFINYQDWEELIDKYFSDSSSGDYKSVSTLMQDYIDKHNIKYADW